jgi:PTS system fructose-specific IIC component
MPVADLTDAQLIAPTLEAKDRLCAIEELADLLDAQGKLHSKRAFVDAVREREALIATELEFGIAIPHARSEAVKDMALAIGRSEGLAWAPDTNSEVRLVFLLAIPSTKPGEDHVKALAALAGLLLEETFREDLLTARDGEQMLRVIREADQEDFDTR